MTRTPNSISLPVRDFCSQINASNQPRYLVITPEPKCEPNNCFECVRQKVVREGGRIQFGWSIWEWPSVYLEAEHHAVHESTVGILTDITPSLLPEIQRRLFLPDDTATYDFAEEGVLKENKRLALNDDPLILEMFRAANRKFEIMNSLPGVGKIKINRETANKISAADEQLARTVHDLGMKYTPQGAFCFCGSGQKFKRCHGRPLKSA